MGPLWPVVLNQYIYDAGKFEGEVARTGCDRVVRVTGELLSSDDMLVPSSDLCASGDSHDIGVCEGDLAASDVLGLDVLDRVVLVRGTETDEGSLALAVDGDFLKEDTSAFCSSFRLHHSSA